MVVAKWINVVVWDFEGKKKSNKIKVLTFNWNLAQFFEKFTFQWHSLRTLFFLIIILASFNFFILSCWIKILIPPLIMYVWTFVVVLIKESKMPINLIKMDLQGQIGADIMWVQSSSWFAMVLLLEAFFWEDNAWRFSKIIQISHRILLCYRKQNNLLQTIFRQTSYRYNVSGLFKSRF